jgi:hypothetical protein
MLEFQRRGTAKVHDQRGTYKDIRIKGSIEHWFEYQCSTKSRTSDAAHSAARTKIMTRKDFMVVLNNCNTCESNSSRSKGVSFW